MQQRFFGAVENKDLVGSLMLLLYVLDLLAIDKFLIKYLAQDESQICLFRHEMRSKKTTANCTLRIVIVCTNVLLCRK